MKIVYDSRTGNTESLAKRVTEEAISIKDVDKINKDDRLLLLTYTFGNGEINKTTEAFLADYGSQVVGVVSTGNVVKHPQTFGHAAPRISERLGVPIVRIVQLKGDEEDVEIIQKWIEK